MLDNQNVVILIVVLVIALIIGLVIVGFVLNRSDSETDQVETSARLQLLSAGAAVVADSQQQQLLTT
jgi:flagellar basal body-associated protein FliL